jgi:hypothetical protein
MGWWPSTLEIRLRKPPLHIKFGGDGFEMATKIVERNIEPGGIEFHAHQKCAGIQITMLIRVQDVAAVLVNKTRNGGDNAFLVWTIEQEYGGFLHHLRPFRSFKISFAAFIPEPPVSPVPGCVPDPQRYKLRIGVR